MSDAHCPKCEALARELEEARLALGWTRAKDREEALRTGLKVTPQQAAILSALYAARGRFITPGVLGDILCAERRSDTDFDRLLKVQIHRVRGRIGAHAIENAFARGYRLSDLGRVICDEAFEAFGAGRGIAA